MLICLVTLGPSYAPNSKQYCELIRQIDERPFGRFLVRTLDTNEHLIINDKHQIELTWVQQSAAFKGES